MEPETGPAPSLSTWGSHTPAVPVNEDVDPNRLQDRSDVAESVIAPRTGAAIPEHAVYDVSAKPQAEPERAIPSDRTRELPVRHPRARVEEPVAFAPGSGAQFAVVLLIAALLGCCVGYWAYLQLPSAVIPLSVRPAGNGLVVSWPADETRDVRYAALRINDGDPVMISLSERNLGQASITSPADDVKIELIAQHWLRDSRGIVRFVRGKTADLSSEPFPSQNAPSTDQQH
jgi:hypothetical protein